MVVSPVPSARGTVRRSVLLGLVGALAAYALLAAHFDFLCDDAYISFRHARNLARGQGLRFNPGEDPPVEGYTNLLWVLWLVPFEWLKLDVGLVSRLSSAACGGLLLFLVARLAQRRLELDALGVATTGLVLATLPPYVVWATGGLGTMGFALALFLVFERLALEEHEPRPLAAGMAALAAVLLRPDGILWVGAVLAAAVIGAPVGGRRTILRASALAGVVAAAGAALQLAFRVGYHEDWLPGPAHVKVSLSALGLERGAKYLASLLVELPFLALLALVAIAWSQSRGRLAWQALIPFVFAALYAIFLGGDFMAMGRFLVPAVPFVALSFACLARALAALKNGRAALLTLWTMVVASSLLCAFDRAPVPDSLRQAMHFRWNEPRAQSETAQWRLMRDRAREWARVGRALALHTRRGESIVLPNLGAIAYPTELFAFDPFGLVSPEVARRKTPPRRVSPGHDKVVDASFFFDRRPDYLGAWIAPGSAPPGTGLPAGFADSPIGRRTRVERFPLAAPDGSPGTEELRILRMVWTD